MEVPLNIQKTKIPLGKPSLKKVYYFLHLGLAPPLFSGKCNEKQNKNNKHASSLRMPREKNCPADTINEFELHDSP